MKTNFKGTKGTPRKHGIYVRVDNKTVADLENDFLEFEEKMHNRDLIIDAFKIRQQINFDLPELLEQRDKAVELLQKLTNDATFLEDAKEFLKTLEK